MKSTGESKNQYFVSNLHKKLLCIHFSSSPIRAETTPSGSGYFSLTPGPIILRSKTLSRGGNLDDTRYWTTRIGQQLSALVRLFMDIAS